MGTFKPDAQAFINFYTGETAKDQQIDDGVELLRKKNLTGLIKVVKVKEKPASEGTKKEINELLPLIDTWMGDKTRLYLHGHGSSKN